MLEQLQSQKQEQQLTAHLLQSLWVLQLPSADLEQQIDEKIYENPILENLKNDSQVVAVPFDFPTLSLTQIRGEHYRGVEEEYYQHAINSLTQEKTLQAQLDEQIQYLDLDYPKRKQLDVVIENLDSRGYFVGNCQEIAQQLNCNADEIESALKLLQSFDPPGIGALDLRHCFLLQLEHEKLKDSLAYRIVDEALESVEKNDFLTMCKQFNVTVDELYEALDTLRHLVPFPGRSEVENLTFYAVPEIVFSLNTSGAFEVSFVRETVPRLTLSDTYIKMLNDPLRSDVEKSFLREKLMQAKGLLSALDNRYKTIYRIGEFLADFQHDFLEKGEDFLKPLALKQVAERLDLHESTISRAITGKYAQTPQGVVELKAFFSAGGFASESGDVYSSQSIKSKIENLLKNENPSKPLSDSKIEQHLKAQGIEIARRTVAKYREEMGYRATHLRKIF